jgi:hypothetical protein
MQFKLPWCSDSFPSISSSRHSHMYPNSKHMICMPKMSCTPTNSNELSKKQSKITSTIYFEVYYPPSQAQKNVHGNVYGASNMLDQWICIVLKKHWVLKNANPCSIIPNLKHKNIPWNVYEARFFRWSHQARQVANVTPAPIQCTHAAGCRQ